jgi:hypothetical protein
MQYSTSLTLSQDESGSFPIRLRFIAEHLDVQTVSGRTVAAHEFLIAARRSRELLLYKGFQPTNLPLRRPYGAPAAGMPGQVRCIIPSERDTFS